MNEKRMRDWCRIAALGLVFAGAACDEPLAGVPPDMAMAAMPDISVGQKLDGGPDLMDPALPDLAVAPSGHVVLTSNEGNGYYFINGEVVRRDTHFFNFWVDFAVPGAAPKHDYSDWKGWDQGGGCVADHYDYANGDIPDVGSDAGLITISGYTGGTLLIKGEQAPPALDCFWTFSSLYGYVCSFDGTEFGDISKMYGGFVAEATPLKKGDPIKMEMKAPVFAGLTRTVAATGRFTLMEDATTIDYGQNNDIVFHYYCEGGTPENPNCGDGMMLARIQAWSGQWGKPSGPTFALLTCAGTAKNGTLTLKKDALQAAFNDSNLQIALLQLSRMDLPEKVTTPDGATVNLAVGNGIMAWSDLAQQ